MDPTCLKSKLENWSCLHFAWILLVSFAFYGGRKNFMTAQIPDTLFSYNIYRNHNSSTTVLQCIQHFTHMGNNTRQTVTLDNCIYNQIATCNSLSKHWQVFIPSSWLSFQCLDLFPLSPLPLKSSHPKPRFLVHVLHGTLPCPNMKSQKTVKGASFHVYWTLLIPKTLQMSFISP